MTDDLACLDATAQADLICRREATPLELVEAAILRIEKLNPELNAVIHPSFERARSQASSVDLPDGPFRGVPFLIKDIFCTEGVETTAGSKILRGYLPPYDATVVRKLKQL